MNTRIFTFKKQAVSLFASLVICAASTMSPLFAHSSSGEREIEMPDIPGYTTLVCDFHQHSAFSDGHVWPTVRVWEAEKDGLDAMAISDHLEWLPHQDDIPHENRNRGYEIARKEAKDSIIVVNGAEITRGMPPGHCNGIFLQDATRLLQDDVMSVFQEARDQGAFVFWNHPSWVAQRPDGVAALTAMHEQLLSEGLIQGIEVVNGGNYSENSLRLALEHNLAIMANSDIHSLIDWDYDVAGGGHRPVTLVFAKEKSETSLKEALFAGRSAAWFKNTLVGRSEYVVPLIEAALVPSSPGMLTSHKGESLVQKLLIKNESDIEFIVENKSSYDLHNQTDIFIIKAHETTLLEVKTMGKLQAFKMQFRVLNVVTGPGQHPVITLDVALAP